MNGTVLFFNAAKGLGFVTADGSEERYFVHESKIRMAGFRALQPGMEVEFEINSGPDGRPQAWSVRPIDFESFPVNTAAKTVNPEKDGIIPLAIEDGKPVIAGREPSVSANTFRAYLAGGRVNGFRFELPRYDGSVVYLVLDPEMKLPVIVDDGQYAFAQIGSYLTRMSVDGHATIWMLGRRHQVENGKNLNWAVVERRFEHRYDLSKPIADQEIPVTSGLERDNDGFVPSIEVCRQFLNQA